MIKKKSQAAMEYLILLGIVLVVLIPLFYYAIQESSRTIQMNQANDVVNSIAKTADSLYALGPGSQTTIEITMPGGVNDISISGNELLLKLYIFGGIADVFATTKANLTGSLNTKSGIYHVNIKVLESGVVQIGE